MLILMLSCLCVQVLECGLDVRIVLKPWTVSYTHLGIYIYSWDEKCLCRKCLELVVYTFAAGDDCSILLSFCGAGEKDKIPVSYTHLDVYKRQALEDVTNRKFTKNMQKKKEKVS